MTQERKLKKEERCLELTKTPVTICSICLISFYWPTGDRGESISTLKLLLLCNRKL